MIEPAMTSAMRRKRRSALGTSRWNQHGGGTGEEKRESGEKIIECMQFAEEMRRHERAENEQGAELQQFGD